MKRLFVISLGVLFLASCNSDPKGYTLKGTITGEPENGTQIFLKTTDSVNQLVDVDTTVIENGLFSFNGNQVEPKMYYVFVDKVRGNVPVIVENGTIEVEFQRDSIGQAKLKGTEQNEIFMGFLEESRKLSERARSMQNDMRMAAQQQDTATVTALREEFIEFQEDAKNFNIDFVKNNPNAFISVLVIGNLLATKAVPVDEVKAMFEGLSPEMKATEPGKKIAEQLENLKSTEVGAIAPDFSAPTPTGDVLALSDVTSNAKLTLVDFWAAWCRPCRAENPNIVSVYKKYHEKGFDVLGVSLDNKEEHWKNAIESDGLVWNHISNLQRFQDPIARLYNINAIPAAFLLDENGVIVARDLRGPALEQKVAEILGKS
ncbi:alkyl hydroperoxide reductase/ Thiol specific antioxidant/ Mal allergen [Allomuricauda ruestringensis DSM 13258]|uniref:Alkyl hydroperoxide reductase/ Thiol specific antioxidant/ Mal allergen n=1 Tax=Allomuricauda ruestringensis (strain DSM 13258 / CIP 107369 / LMG 19739 / B1) TaxID=886377 RepID=G2PLD1_ALLRU|nr:TlpA disulfide reductase family protein [Allomuricauda ruestringensis]AEM72188.1 alkyl hydroperoxide reductase/ Thiol specific antioxidant/ Mal allergen [Allomuricauda ruestringensis DSM 13258]